MQRSLQCRPHVRHFLQIGLPGAVQQGGRYHPLCIYPVQVVSGKHGRSGPSAACLSVARRPFPPFCSPGQALPLARSPHTRTKGEASASTSTSPGAARRVRPPCRKGHSRPPHAKSRFSRFSLWYMYLGTGDYGPQYYSVHQVHNFATVYKIHLESVHCAEVCCACVEENTRVATRACLACIRLVHFNFWDKHCQFSLLRSCVPLHRPQRWPACAAAFAETY